MTEGETRGFFRIPPPNGSNEEFFSVKNIPKLFLAIIAWFSFL